MSPKNASPIGRRNFLKALGLTATGAAGLAACTTKPTLVNPQYGPATERALKPIAATPLPVTATVATMPGMDMTATNPPQQGGPSADDMDAMMESGVKIFLDNAGKHPEFWGTKLDYKMDGDVKVFELNCQAVKWDVGGGATVDAMTYNGIVPGPEIRITQGDKVRIVVNNQLAQSTGVHWHGVLVPNTMDGVPFITQPPIKPGASFTYEFEAKNPGSHMYHSHHNAAEQVSKGMLGPFIIEPKDKSGEPQYGADYNLVLNDAGIGLTLNGKSFPYTQPIIAKQGDTIRVRYMNEGMQIHPMHLHGLEQLVISKDGWMLEHPYTADTVLVAPGERYDVIVNCHTPGAWAFHCHILIHAESSSGMFGMVTALVVQ